MLKDWTLKLFSLCVAILLFLFVTVESATPIDVDVPVEYQLGDELTFTNFPVSTVRTTLQGPSAAFRTFLHIEEEPLSPILIDLTKAQPGPLHHRLDIRDILAPPGMRVVAVQPIELELVLDRKVERLIPVSADLAERPAFGFQIAEVTIEPARVRVTGPAAKIAALDFVYTKGINVNGLTADQNLQVELRPPPLPLRLIEKRVRVSVHITEEVVERTFAHVLVSVAELPEGSSVVPSELVLTLRGPKRLVEVIDEKTVIARVTPSPRGLGRYESQVTLSSELLERTEIVGGAPKVLVQLGRRKP